MFFGWHSKAVSTRAPWFAGKKEERGMKKLALAVALLIALALTLSACGGGSGGGGGGGGGNVKGTVTIKGGSNQSS
jgi:hypothetical protein